MERFFYSQDFDFLYKGTGILLAIYLINPILLYFQSIFLSRLGQQVVLHIRKNLFAQMIALPHSFFEKAQTGDLTSRISKDTADTQDILESFITIFVRSVPTMVGILIVSFSIDWIYALTFVVAIPLLSQQPLQTHSGDQQVHGTHCQICSSLGTGRGDCPFESPGNWRYGTAWRCGSSFFPREY